MNKDKLQQYLKSPYKDGNSFLENIVFPIFGEDDFVSGEDKEWLDEKPEYRTLAANTGIRSVKLVGTVYLDSLTLQIFDVAVADKVVMERNRVTIQKLVLQIMTHVSCAFMLFHYDNDVRWDWRFTFCYKGGKDSENTDSKRYTFLLGPNQSCHTARNNFWDLMTKHDKGQVVDFKDLEEAFSVEALSNEFFEKYKNRYEKFVSYVTGKAYVKTGGKYVEKVVNTDNDKVLYAAFGNDDKRVRDYVKRLLGRILFLHFVQKKGWLGLPAGETWDSGNGDFDFMKHLYTEASPEQQNDFLDSVLEPLFTAIDTNRATDDYLYDTKVLGNLRVPYLNGGLFERDADDEITSRFPKEYFADLLEFFSQYNFTVDENDPNDAQVGIDPEMLSRIFENLLEDNKDKGAYYTPKEVVHHMCRESLIAYLQTGYDEEHCKAIRKFVETHDASALELSQPSETATFKNDIDKRLREVKVCDPAIGSGAFPMGMLKEIFLCRCALEEVTDNAEIKRQIIQNNIYGVDIEKGAVEIARLRFWLSLIVDEKSPETLPNLDFKIMQGNSLLESYKGVDLSNIVTKKTVKDTQVGVEATFFDDEVDILRKQLSDRLSEYYNCDDHAKKAEMRKEIAEIIQQQLSIQKFNVSLDGIDIHSNDQFFLWHTWFNDVFSRPNKQGFDITISNPPYKILTKNNTDNKLLSYYLKGYDSIKNSNSKNLYTLFIEMAITKLMKNNGILSYIVPEGLYTTRSYTDCTNIMEQNGETIQIVTFEGYVFEKAVTGNIIFLYVKSKDGRKTEHLHFDSNYNLSKILKKEDSVIMKMSASEYKLKDIATIFKGMVVSDRKKIVSEVQTDGRNDKFLLGKNISKWSIDSCFWADYNSLKIIGGTKKLEKHNHYPRILIRRTGDTLCCAYLNEAALTESTLYSCWSTNTKIENLYLLGLLNSRLMDYYNRKCNITNQQGFPQILMTDLENLPIKDADTQIQRKINALCTTIIGNSNKCDREEAESKIT